MPSLGFSPSSARRLSDLPCPASSLDDSDEDPRGKSVITSFTSACRVSDLQCTRVSFDVSVEVLEEDETDVDDVMSGELLG